MAQQAPIQSLFDSMSEMQKQLWSQWMKPDGSAPVGEQLERTYQQQLDLGEQLVDQSLKVQEQWVHQFCGALKGNSGTPEEMKEMIGRMEQTMEGMLKARTELWHGWFNQARQIHMDKLPMPPGADAWARMVEGMEQQVRDTMDKAAQVTEEAAPSASETRASGSRTK